MFCKKCLLKLGRGLEKDDLRVIEALHNNGALNKESVSQVTGLTTSKLRDSLSRLKGARLIEESRIGNSALLRLSEDGRALVNSLKELTKGGSE